MSRSAPDRAHVPRDEDKVRHFVEQFAAVLADWGMPRMSARVLITLLSADEDSLTAADLADRLGASPAAISGAVRYLTSIGLLARLHIPGDRRVRYSTPDDFWYEASLAKSALWKRLTDLAHEGLAATGGPTTPAGRRMTQMVDYFIFLQDRLHDLFEEWQVHKRAKGRAAAGPA